MPLTHNQLLSDLEPLAHRERFRRMVELGRQAATDDSIRMVIAALGQGDFYQRGLALMACYGSRDGAAVLRGLEDPSRGIRARAADLVWLACDDAQALQALTSGPAYLRRTLLRSLHRHRRVASIDAFLGQLAEAGDPQLGALLSYGSGVFVRRHLAQILPAAGYDDWRRLARLHPEIAADALQQLADRASGLDQRLLAHARAALPRLSKSLPDRALGLVGSLSRHIAAGLLPLDVLASHRPNEIADLVIATDDQVRVTFERIVDRLAPERLAALANRRPGSLGARSVWLKRLAPAQRASLYQICGQSWRDDDGALGIQDAALLPAELRAQEGRRNLALPALATRPEQRLPYAALLPWDEARATLEPFLRNPDPNLRIVANGALVAAARYQRSHLAELLAHIRARKNEQDPVRGMLLSGLAELPPARWQPEHLDDLGQVIRDALDAADLSHATASAAERLVVAILPFHSAWAIGWLTTLVKERGQLNMYRLELRLSDEDVRRIAPVLLPVLQSWATRERESQLLGAAGALGRRLRAFDALAELLGQLLRDTPSGWLAARALDLLARHQRAYFEALVPRLLREDPSWATQQVVYTYLHTRRQDLITPFLGRQAYRGRFSTGKTRFVLPLQRGFERWTTSQQASFAQTLDEVTRDAGRDSPALLATINQLAALPGVPPTRLLELARLDNPQPAVRDSALRALGRLDGGQAVAFLLEALADDRGRIAIYALRRALLIMPSGAALALLRGMPLTRVTVAKEIVRLIGDLRSEPAFRELLAIAARDLHRDVRVALLRALWEHVERDEAWPVLEAAAADVDPAVARGVIRIPADRISPLTQRRLAALIAMLLRYPEPRVRLETLHRLAQLPLTDAERALRPALAAALASPIPDEQSAAAGAIFATYVGRDAALVGEALRAAAPNRRALNAALVALGAAAAWMRGHLLPTVQAVIAALEGDRLTAELRVRLAIQALGWEDLPALLERMSQRGELHADSLAAAIAALAQAGRRPAAEEGLVLVERALAGNANAHLRRLALAALAVQGQVYGWSSERQARLAAFRADEAALVAAAAQFTLPPDG